MNKTLITFFTFLFCITSSIGWSDDYDNGQLLGKVNFKNGKREGSYLKYNKDGKLNNKHSGTYKNDIKIKD